MNNVALFELDKTTTAQNSDKVLILLAQVVPVPYFYCLVSCMMEFNLFKHLNNALFYYFISKYTVIKVSWFKVGFHFFLYKIYVRYARS
jgi:hypothetical protein